MQCQQNKNLKDCPCTYTSCPRHGICCKCIRYHRQNDELPGCYFSKKEEATYDRSITNFIKDHS